MVSKIASVDFPNEWSELFPQLVSVLNSTSSDAAVQGSLRVLYELVDSGLSDEQFFGVASDLVTSLQNVTVKTGSDPVVQAMALRVLGSCFDNLEQVLATEHAAAVKGFLSDSMRTWMPFFISTLKVPLPEVNQADFEDAASNAISKWKGVIAVKIQVIQVRRSEYSERG